MRATYRWAALAMLSFWLLIVISAAQSSHLKRVLGALALVAIVALNLPSPNLHWYSHVNPRSTLEKLDRDLVPALEGVVGKNQRVAFFPWGNDFLANYLAPRAKFVTFNIGGDKNLQRAQEDWPSEFFVQGGSLESSDVQSILKLLVSKKVDVIAIPYFNMQWAPFSWPCSQAAAASAGMLCPEQRKAEVRQIVNQLRSEKDLTVIDTPYFAAVKLANTSSTGVEDVLASHISTLSYPILIRPGQKELSFLLSEGWFEVSDGGAWSKETAVLEVPVPVSCRNVQSRCQVRMSFMVFGASPSRPVRVNFKTSEIDKDAVFSSPTGSFDVPLTNGQANTITITVNNPTSPKALGLSEDKRILGLGLQRLDVEK